MYRPLHHLTAIMNAVRRPQTGWVIAAACLMSTSALMASGSLPHIMRPEYFSRDLLLFIEGLDLSDEQQVICEMVFEDYERSFNEGVDNMKQQVESVADAVQQHGDDKDAIVAAVLMPIEGWARQRDVLGHQLVENIRVILDQDQQRAWTAFNRRLDREKQLPQGTLSGESTNLQHVMRDMALSPAEGSPASEAMLRWELALHEQLIARTAASGEGLRILDQIRSGSATTEDINRRRRELAARVEVRDVTDTSIEEIAALLGDQGSAFREKALMIGYGRIYRPSAVARLFDNAMKSDKVTSDPALLNAVRELYGQYRDELGELQEELLRVTRIWEPELESAKIENRARQVEGLSRLRPEDPTRELHAERRTLDHRYAQMLRDLLGDDIFSSLDGATRFIPRSRPQDPGEGLRGDPKGNGRLSPTGTGSQSSGSKQKKGTDKNTIGRSTGSSSPQPRGDD
ncbi:MAG: hypothetical protein MK100_08950 [Phycisphaerales bacterium]|nr:hypothetical protein [Phycisphaerales bacterium]